MGMVGRPQTGHGWASSSRLASSPAMRVEPRLAAVLVDVAQVLGEGPLLGQSAVSARDLLMERRVERPAGLEQGGALGASSRRGRLDLAALCWAVSEGLGRPTCRLLVGRSAARGPLDACVS